jgi:enterochelin esterase-like enzyme
MSEIVTERFDFDGGRSVTVHVPTRPPEGIVFAGDGQRVARWGAAVEATEAPPTMIVGVHGLTDETARLHEYSPVFDERRFTAHETFVVDTVREWVRSRFEIDRPAERTAVFGASAAGELALALGIRHPDVFGTILAGSPGAGYRPPEALEARPGRLPRTYLVAGTGEPFFLDNAARWADALRAAGADVVFSRPAGTHGSALWRAEFPLMLAWAFRP